jgi:FeS assembly SUF system regulator
MLRMSKLADYGTVILVAMARNPDAVHSAASLASATGIPLPTVAKVTKILARGGLTVSLRGASGGYVLQWPPQRLTLADIIAAMDGPFGMTECSAAPGVCLQESVCGARANWQKVNRLVLEALRQVSLADMAGPVLSEIDISAIRMRDTRAVPDAAPLSSSLTRAAGSRTALRKASAPPRALKSGGHA